MTSDLLDLLRSIELCGGIGTDRFCPVCGGIGGHAPDCRLDRAIRELAEQSPGEPTVEQWRAANGLEWSVTKSGSRWVAQFKDCHVSPGRKYIGGTGVYGEGQTPEAAQRDYPRKIEGELLCHCPGWKVETMRHLDVPRFAATTEPTVDEMAREMGLTYLGSGYWDKNPAKDMGLIHTEDQVRTLYREHKAKQQPHAGSNLLWTAPEPPGDIVIVPEATGATSFNDNTYIQILRVDDIHNSVIFGPLGGGRAEFDLDTGKATLTGDIDEAARAFWSAVERIRMPPKDQPPTDPSALAAWLYARVVPGQTVAEYRWGEVMRRQAVVTEKGAAVDIDHVTIDILAGELLFTIPGSPKFVRLLNPDGSVLWEAK